MSNYHQLHFILFPDPGLLTAADAKKNEPYKKVKDIYCKDPKFSLLHPDHPHYNIKYVRQIKKKDTQTNSKRL